MWWLGGLENDAVAVEDATRVAMVVFCSGLLQFKNVESDGIDFCVLVEELGNGDGDGDGDDDVFYR